MRVTAVVVTWNSADVLAGCLHALDELEYDDLDVIVVDNASVDRSRDIAVAAAEVARHPTRLVANPTNRGFTGGVNDALALLDDDVEAVLLVNPDAAPDPQLVTRAVDVLANRPQVGSVQPLVVREVPGRDGQQVVDSTGHVMTTARLWRNRDEGKDVATLERPAGTVFGVSGALALHRRAMLDDVAWRRPGARREVLTESLVAYFDDVELDWRARCRGWSAWYEPAAIGTHVRAGAARRRSTTVEALNAANRLAVIAVCDDRRALVRAAPLVAVTSALKFVELAVTQPRALLPMVRQLRAVWPDVPRRRRQLHARATVPSRLVLEQFLEPFSWRRWIAVWWRRITGRAPGSA